MTQQLILKTSKIPTLYGQDGVKDPMVHIKLFTAYSSWTWLLTEYDPEQDLAFGFCYNSQDPDNAELGYVSIAELRNLKKFGAPAIERDIHFLPKLMSAAKKVECPNLRK